MEDKKNIDRLFQEKFKDFEVKPNDAIWDRINENLPNKKKKRRVIAIWWKLGGIAAAIALLLTVGISVFNSKENKPQELPYVNIDKNTNTESLNKTEDAANKILNSPKATKKENNQVADSDFNSEQNSNSKDLNNETIEETYSSNKITTPNKAEQKSDAVVNNTDEEIKKASQKPKTSRIVNHSNQKTEVTTKTKSSDTTIEDIKINSKTERKSTINKTIKNNKTAVVENTLPKKVKTETLAKKEDKTELTEPENLLIEETEKTAIENAIAENNETTIEEEKEDTLNRWSISPNVAPVYFNSLGEGSSIDNQFNKNTKNSDINMSYGITGSYAISNKIKIRTGINRVNLNQTTTDVFAFTGAETAARGLNGSFSNITFSEDKQSVSLMSSEMMNRSSAPELLKNISKSEIDQRFSFIEVPLELEYKLLDRKFGINIIGGFSTFFLSENEIYADINGVSEQIGEANNINDTSFSANFGLGMDYSLSKQWYINLEPTFKYQLNTFNNTTDDFKPFFIGIYTGLNYKF
ncbi:hypothetical protein H7F37_11640 [Winogradskyella sp. PAMC22761]|nr:hypothetical protein H7F37_11640 [Winogradskyella sp. PAMC22761]